MNLTEKQVNAVMQVQNLDAAEAELDTCIEAFKKRQVDLRGMKERLRLELVSEIGRPLDSYEIESLWRVCDVQKTDTGKIPEGPKNDEKRETGATSDK